MLFQIRDCERGYPVLLARYGVNGYKRGKKRDVDPSLCLEDGGLSTAFLSRLLVVVSL
jgi:hypothetical protein